MAVSRQRWKRVTESAFPWEAEALEYIRAVLPECDSYCAGPPSRLSPAAMNFRGNNRRIEKLAAASAEAVPMACQAGEVVRQWRETGEFSFPDKSPDGSERYLVDEAILGSLTERLGGDLADPLKTTVVQNQRSMTTWVLRKKLP